MKEMTLIGYDGWDRPVYKDETGQLWKDINLGQGEPYLHDADDFDGEPGFPIEEKFIITERT